MNKRSAATTYLTRTVAAAALLAISLAACGPDNTKDSTAAAAPAAAAPAKGGSVCALLTLAEVAKAIDAAEVTAEVTEHGPPLGAKQCVWGTDTMP